MTISNPVIIDFIASALFSKIKNEESIDDDTLQLFYNSVIIDAIRSNHLKSEDKFWVRDRLFSNKPQNKLLSNYLINFYQAFVNKSDKEQLFNSLNNEKQVAYCFLISKVDLSVSEMKILYEFIIENWTSFVREETYYENPFDYNFDNFQNTLSNRLFKMATEGLNKLWLYVLSTKAIIGNDSNSEFFSKIKSVCDEKLNNEPDKEIISFYNQNIFKLIQ